MTVNGTAKQNTRRTKNSSKPSSSEATNENVEAQAMSADNTVKTDSSEANKGEDMATDNVVKITARPVQAEAQKDGAIQLHQPTSMVWNRPVMPSDIKIADTITVAGVRPIAASDIQVYASYLNGRPISASSLKVQEMLPGDRPIFVSDFHAVEGMMLPGDRPVMVSDPQLLQASMLPGNRPIASNDIIDPEPAALMGYLD